MSSPHTAWIRRSPAPHAPWRLLCFHHAGGGASAFNLWPKLFEGCVEVLTVQLPGRENRLQSPLLSDPQEVLEALAAELATIGGGDRPLAFVGHSLGAYLAYHLALYLRACDLQPARLFIAGAPAPHEPDRLALTHTEGAQAQEDQDTIIARLRDLGGTPPAVLNDPRMMERTVRTLRSDSRLMQGLLARPVVPVAIPFTLLYGEDDPATAEGKMDAWRSLSSAGVAEWGFPGGHFFIVEHRCDIIQRIQIALKGL